MIYPSTHDIIILQDSTYEQDYLITQSTKACTVNDATNTISAPCHKLLSGDRVVFSVENGELPCGINGGAAYYIISSGLTDGAFKISASLGGSELDFTAISQGATYYVSKILNLTGYTFDSDVRASYGGTQLATMGCAVLDAASGALRVSLSPTQTRSLSEGEYVWDLKLKTTQKSFFYAYGRASVVPTSSRD